MLEDFAVMLQGNKSDCAVLRVDERVLLLDTGWEEDFYRLDGFLQEKEITTIDYLIVSHFDLDHVGGVLPLIEKYRVKTMIVPDYIPQSEKKAEILVEIKESCRLRMVCLFYLWKGQSESYHDGGLRFTNFLSPCVKMEEIEDENEYSLVTSVEFKGKKLLFMGDAETNLTKYYVENLVSEHDFLKLPHHASYKNDAFVNQYMETLLEKVNPTFALATCKAEKEKKILKALKKIAPSVKFTSNLHGNVDILAEL